jgi:two-component system, NtrC family, response regulator GlrR
METARLIDSLKAVFSCSFFCPSEFTSVQDLTNGAKLVIWELASESGEQVRPDIAQLLIDASCLCPVLVITEGLDVSAFNGIAPHIAEFVLQPYTCDELVLRAKRAIGLKEDAATSKKTVISDRLEGVVVGGSAVLKKEVDKLKRFAECDASVLILGETGTGKEVFAQAVHYVSLRAARPMVAINCGAVPAELMEAELFGHVKGAYTNAHVSRTGLVCEAEGGTLFLDDVDCLALSAQAKLLRFLQEREYRVVGSNDVRHADVRVICASNRDLAKMVT